MLEPMKLRGVRCFAAGGVAIVLLAGVLLGGCGGSAAGPPPPLTASPEPTAEATPHAAATPVRETGGSAPTTVPTQRAVDTGATPKSDPGTTPHGDSRADSGGSSSLLRGVSLDDGAATFANAFAGQEGVILSSPNWQSAVTRR